MRKHGWELPYHPLQVVAVAVFLALGFAFYVFFAPFVGKKQFEYVVVALYTPLVASVFCLYVWCTAANAVDPGVLKYKKYLNMVDNTNHSHLKGSRHEGGSTSSMNKDNASTIGDKPLEQGASTDPVEWRSPNEFEQENASCYNMPVFLVLFGWCPLSPQWNWNCSREQASKHASSEDGMFYCSLCEAEVCKYSKHCRVCDKCVDGFDHHCRWLNNCIGRKNYWGFFILMLSALLLLVLQWSLGIVLLICCFLERKRFAVEIPSKLGSSFTLVPFVVVVAFCTFLAMVATLPLAQLFSFHVLLIKKGISTYDYIMVLREQEQLGVGGQSPQMSPVSSATGLSTASSFTTFQRGAWCTPPRLFLEDQFDAILPENSASKRMAVEEHNRSKNTGTIKISPWTLVRLNTEEVSKVAAQARRKSRTLQPVVRREAVPGQETDSSIGSSGHLVSRLDNRRHATKRAMLPADLPLESLTKRSASATNGSVCDIAAEASTSLAPLQLDARRAFHINKTMTFNGLFASSPDSNLDSPGLHSLRVSSSGAEDCQGLATIRSTSDGYEASGGEDSDRIPSRITHRSSNWRDLVLSSGHDDTDAEDILRASYSEGMQANNGGRF